MQETYYKKKFWELVQLCREIGLSHQDIGDFLGCSKQNIIKYDQWGLKEFENVIFYRYLTWCMMELVLEKGKDKDMKKEYALKYSEMMTKIGQSWDAQGIMRFYRWGNKYYKPRIAYFQELFNNTPDPLKIDG